MNATYSAPVIGTHPTRPSHSVHPITPAGHGSVPLCGPTLLDRTRAGDLTQDASCDSA
ncbi:hypothetical protein [Brevibacterium yomogidense]|uniref:hypothetical protein n=1 Tax=Brevibacterium yomogidense TaxID=946573 RepID=UPI0018DFAEBB|nr:hypothetical protein [Brevibacterium yomogidense]